MPMDMDQSKFQRLPYYEAIELRNAGITAPILLLNYLDYDSFDNAIDADLSITIIDTDSIQKLSEMSKRK
jgi:alanine racemase